MKSALMCNTSLEVSIRDKDALACYWLGLQYFNILLYIHTNI